MNLLFVFWLSCKLLKLFKITFPACFYGPALFAGPLYVFRGSNREEGGCMPPCCEPYARSLYLFLRLVEIVANQSVVFGPCTACNWRLSVSLLLDLHLYIVAFPKYHKNLRRGPMCPIYFVALPKYHKNLRRGPMRPIYIV